MKKKRLLLFMQTTNAADKIEICRGIRGHRTLIYSLSFLNREKER